MLVRIIDIKETENFYVNIFYEYGEVDWAGRFSGVQDCVTVHADQLYTYRDAINDTIKEDQIKARTSPRIGEEWTVAE